MIMLLRITLFNIAVWLIVLASLAAGVWVYEYIEERIIACLF